MKLQSTFSTAAIVASALAIALSIAPTHAANGDASAVSALSALPLASVVIAAGAGASEASGAAIAFVPSELGRALLHNERLTY